MSTHLDSADSAAPSVESSRSRRDFLQTVALTLGGLLVSRPVRAADVQPAAAARTARSMTVYKDPNCGCCTQWIEHVRGAGFAVTVRDTADMTSVKASFGVPEGLQSCHTAKVGAYTIEGHVPADLITKLLAEQPAGARGLAVPGMPVGSPGMEMGGRKDAYDVVLFDKGGKTRVFARR
jgi:hypothetical protein